MEVKSFENLEVWQIGRDLVTKVYMLTVSLPQSETFGLIAQIERAALSVPANIAEGFGRYHYMDKAKFGRKIAQRMHGRHLLRVVFEEHADGYLVMTAYPARPQRYLRW
jgi:hypothetical protein